MQVGIADPQMPSGVDVNVVRMTEAVHNWYGEAAEYTLFCLLPLSSAKPMSSEWQCWEYYIGFSKLHILDLLYLPLAISLILSLITSHTGLIQGLEHSKLILTQGFLYLYSLCVEELLPVFIMTDPFSSLGFQLTCHILKEVFPTILFNLSTPSTHILFYNYIIIIYI